MYKIIIFTSLIIILVFTYDALSHYVYEKTKFIDELLSYSFFSLIILNTLKKGSIKLLRFEKLQSLALFLLMLSGVCSHLFFKRNNFQAFYTDFIIFFKFYAAYLSARYFLKIPLFKFKKFLTYFFSTCFFFLASLIIVNKVFHIFPQVDPRLGFYSEELFFSHPSRMAFAFEFLFILLFPFLVNKSSGRILLILVMIFGLTSMRYKYFCFCIVALLFFYLIDKVKKITLFNKKVLVMLILGFFVIILITAFQIKSNYSKVAYEYGIARAKLLYTSFSLAKKYFPLGSGFGTFGSYASQKYYSPVYYEFSLDKIYGLSPGANTLICDTYWPMVLGQFGYLGLLFIVLVLYWFMRAFVKLYNMTPSINEKALYLSALLLLLTLILDSSSDTTLVQNRAVAACMYMGVVVNYYFIAKNNENSDNK